MLKQIDNNRIQYMHMTMRRLRVGVAMYLCLSCAAFSVAFAQEQVEVPSEVPVTQVSSAAAPDTSTEASSNDSPVASGSVPTSERESVVTEDVTPTDPSTSDTNQVTLVQDTFNTQDSVTADVLESTTNPDVVPTENSSVVSVETASTTDVIVEPGEPADTSSGESDVTTVAEGALDVIPSDVLEQDPTVQAPVGDPAELSPVLDERELQPKPEYVFALSGNIIPTKRVVNEDGTKREEETVSDVVVPTVDNVTGVVRIEGACTDVYYVVLLFKNQDDYANDPRSFIVNRAYPCIDGHYSYEINRLPVNLENGKYYLLVGSQGERGMWKPITGLTEITINRSQ
jgi:hypothetical protein